MEFQHKPLGGIRVVDEKKVMVSGCFDMLPQRAY